MRALDVARTIAPDELSERAANGTLTDLEGRAPVLLAGAGGSQVNPVDVSRGLREFPLVAHRLTQRPLPDGSVTLQLKPVPERPLDLQALQGAVSALFGGLRIDVVLDDALGEGTTKVMPYRVETEVEAGPTQSDSR